MLRADTADWAIGACVQRDTVLCVDIIRYHRILHADRREDVLLNKVLPGLTRYRLNQRAGNNVENVVVGEFLAEPGHRLQITQGMHDIGARAARGWNNEQIAFAEA